MRQTAVPNPERPSDPAGGRLYLKDVVKDRIQYENGYLIVPEDPGLGMEVSVHLMAKKPSFFTPGKSHRTEKAIHCLNSGLSCSKNSVSSILPERLRMEIDDEKLNEVSVTGW